MVDVAVIDEDVLEVRVVADGDVNAVGAAIVSPTEMSCRLLVAPIPRTVIIAV